MATDEWSDTELREAVRSYLWMLRLESEGTPYNKSEINRSLREGLLKNRSKSSVECRMQNISAVLEGLCLPRVKGYVPAKNLGTSVKDRIQRLLVGEGVYVPDEYSPTADNHDLDEKARRLRRKISGIPKGIATPQQVQVFSASFYRDPRVKAWVLNNAKGVCEGCKTQAPFSTIYGDPYLEVHHIRPLSEGGADTIFNSVALCPNCHRRCHVSSDSKEFSDFLCRNINRPIAGAEI
jgi:5-methylcytosine-specific restriction protein A